MVLAVLLSLIFQLLDHLFPVMDSLHFAVSLLLSESLGDDFAEVGLFLDFVEGDGFVVGVLLKPLSECLVFESESGELIVGLLDAVLVVFLADSDV